MKTELDEFCGEFCEHADSECGVCNDCGCEIEWRSWRRELDDESEEVAS